MKPILLLVDLQNDYLAAPGLEPGRGHIIERAAALLRGCRELSIPVIHVWTTVSCKDDHRMPHWKQMNRWTCEEGTHGHRPPDSISPTAGEAVVHKTFFSGFSGHELERHLKSLGADTVVVAGVHLHACVRQTALDAVERGYRVWIASDATGSNDPVHAAITRRYLGKRAAQFAEVDDLMARLRSGSFPGGASSVSDIVSTTTARARRGFEAWSGVDDKTKRAMLERLASLFEEQAVDLAGQMAREIGKPVFYGEAEAGRSAAMLRALVRRFEDSADAQVGPGIFLRRRPHGVVALITPWNNPVYIALGKIVPALLAGNAVVWKASPRAMDISRRMLELLKKAGCPEDAVCLLEGGRAEAEELMSDPQIDAVSLTGSSQAGFSAQEICAQRRIPLQAELGGNNAAIVWHDSDLYQAAGLIAEGAFGMAGQRCTANRRVILHHEVRDQFLERLLQTASALPSGDPLHPDTRVGPMVSQAHRERLEALLEQCPPDKSKVIRIGMNRFAPLPPEQAGAWHPPTLVCCDNPALDTVQEETFGPVLVVQTAADWGEAMRLCNGVGQGLVASLFSGSKELQRDFLESAQAGILKINRATADADVDVPFGGWKASGVGPPEHGRFDRDFYSRPQTCYTGENLP